MNLRSLFSAAAVLASLAVPMIANAQKVPTAMPVQPRTVYVPAQAPVQAWEHRGVDRRVDVQRQIEARRAEEVRRAELARRAEAFRRAEELRRLEALHHGRRSTPAFDARRDHDRAPGYSAQRGSDRGGRH